MVPYAVILGAGFGGLELAAQLSALVADRIRVTLIDQNDTFLFGFAKLDVLCGRSTLEQIRHAYRDVKLPAVEFRQERVTAIDPVARRVTTDQATYEPDILIVALGADYDPSATPGFVEDGYEFYTPEGADRLHARLLDFTGGQVLVAVLGVPFKCPPAPYEATLLLDDYLTRRGVRGNTRIEVITPMASPIPVSPATSAAIVRELTRRDITYTPSRRVRELDPRTHTAVLKDGARRYDLFIGIPVHRAPAVIDASGLTTGGTDGWIAVNPHTLATPFPHVYAIGDCADVPVPRAGVFAESAARALAANLAASIRGDRAATTNNGTGTCYIEFGRGTVARVDVDFLSGPAPIASFINPSRELSAEKRHRADERRQRWFAGYGEQQTSSRDLSDRRRTAYPVEPRRAGSATHRSE